MKNMTTTEECSVAVTAPSDAPSGLPTPTADAPPNAASPAGATRLTALSALTAAALAACGGGSDAPPGSSPGGLGGSQPVNISATDAARFLQQAQLSSTEADIGAVRAKGYEAWLDEQMGAPTYISGWDWLMSQGYNREDVIFNGQYADFMIWNQLMLAPDGLRKRVALALSEIFVVSANGLDGQSPSFALAAYWDLLNQNAFGTYRQLLEAVTLNPAMGMYLNTLNNNKENAQGRRPDENYAREVMQLFTIGLNQLNLDGTPRMSGGKPIDTYGPDDVLNLARVFTGYVYDTAGHVRATNPLRVRNPMKFDASRHSTMDANFLGTSIGGSTPGPEALKRALDTLANHANVGPFIGRQLIQRLVTSAPSGAYVQRVASAFNNNGQGVRGDLRAVIKAVLLDSEARRDPSLAPPGWGKLREPMLRLVQWGRTFGVSSADGTWKLYDLSDPSSGIGQSPMRSPSVFNFFRPGFVPPNTALAASGQSAPEFQITDENSVAAYANFMRNMVAYGYGSAASKIKVNQYTRPLQLVADPAALVDHLSLVLAGGQLSTSTQSRLRDALATVKADTDAGKNNRVWAAVLMVLCCPEYIVQK